MFNPFAKTTDGTVFFYQEAHSPGWFGFMARMLASQGVEGLILGQGHILGLQDPGPGQAPTGGN